MICLRGQRMERPEIIDSDAFELASPGWVRAGRRQAYLLPTMMLRVPVTGGGADAARRRISDYSVILMKSEIKSSTEPLSLEAFRISITRSFVAYSDIF